MSILIYLIPISLVLLGVAVWAFFWAVRRNQFDDLDTPAIDILADDRNEPAARSTAELRRQRDRRASASEAETDAPHPPDAGTDTAAACSTATAQPARDIPAADKRRPRPHAD